MGPEKMKSKALTYVSLKFCVGIVAALLSHCFHSSIIRKALVLGFSRVSTFMFLPCTG
jgi:hypothetical protein